MFGPQKHQLAPSKTCLAVLDMFPPAQFSAPYARYDILRRSERYYAATQKHANFPTVKVDMDMNLPVCEDRRDKTPDYNQESHHPRYNQVSTGQYFSVKKNPRAA
jgi:hypothetical protein